MFAAQERSTSWLIGAFLLVWVAGWWTMSSSDWRNAFLEDLILTTEAEGAQESGTAPLVLGEFRSPDGVDVGVRTTFGSGVAATVSLGESTTGAVVSRLRVGRRVHPQRRTFVVSELEDGKSYRIKLASAKPDPGFERLDVYTLHPAHRYVVPIYLILPIVLFSGVWLRRRELLVGYLRSPGGSSRRLDVATGILIFSLTVVAFRSARVVQMADAKFLTVVTHEFLTNGDIDLPDHLGRDRKGRLPYLLKEHDGRVYHFFSHAPAILNTPFVLPAMARGMSPMSSDGSFLSRNELQILRTSAATVSALLCVVLFMIARTWLPPPASFVLTFIFAFGTQVFSTLSRPYWSHTWGTFLLALAIFLLVRESMAVRPMVQAVAATAIAWAFFCRPTFSIAALGVTLYVALRYGRRVWFLIATGFAWFCLLVAHSHAVFGQALPPYLLSSHVRSGRLLSENSSQSYVEALFGTLISPGRGLFVYVPISLFTLFLIARHWRRLPDTRLAAIALGVFLLHWQLVSSFRTWWGGWCFGPRLFSDILPWLFLLTVMGVSAAASCTTSRRSNAAMVSMGLVAAAFSIFVNVRGATDPATTNWRLPEEAQRSSYEGSKERVFQRTKLWNWRYPQFMAGLIAPEASGVDSHQN